MGTINTTHLHDIDTPEESKNIKSDPTLSPIDSWTFIYIWFYLEALQPLLLQNKLSLVIWIISSEVLRDPHLQHLGDRNVISVTTRSPSLPRMMEGFRILAAWWWGNSTCFGLLDVLFLGAVGCFCWGGGGYRFQSSKLHRRLVALTFWWSL